MSLQPSFNLFDTPDISKSDSIKVPFVDAKGKVIDEKFYMLVAKEGSKHERKAWFIAQRDSVKQVDKIRKTEDEIAKMTDQERDEYDYSVRLQTEPVGAEYEAKCIIEWCHPNGLDCSLENRIQLISRSKVNRMRIAAAKVSDDDFFIEGLAQSVNVQNVKQD